MVRLVAPKPKRCQSSGKTVENESPERREDKGALTFSKQMCNISQSKLPAQTACVTTEYSMTFSRVIEDPKLAESDCRRNERLQRRLTTEVKIRKRQCLGAYFDPIRLDKLEFARNTCLALIFHNKNLMAQFLRVLYTRSDKICILQC